MCRLRILTFALTWMVVMAMTPFREQSEAANSATCSSPAAVQVAKNKFVAKWNSQITTASGDVIDDGVLEISDVAEPSDYKVSVLHSVRGGPVTGHTMQYPDRIEIQIPMGDGRVAHYNAILVSPTKMQGRFFITGQTQSHHAPRRSVRLEEDGTFQAQAGGG